MSEQKKRLTDAELQAARDAYDAGEAATCSEDELFDDHFQAREDRKRLADMLRNFAETAKAAVAHHERPKTGMQVPFHGDFAHVPPSSISRLRWWAHEMRTLLAEVES